MANLAQEEADRMLNYKAAPPARHPEDREDSVSDLEEKPSRKTIRDNEEDLDTDDEEAQAAADMATMTTSKTSYRVPSTAQFANTGPKGVIADAQNYQKARRSGFRRTINSISDSLSFRSKSKTRTPVPEQYANGHSSGSDIDLDDEDDFMQRWREQRIAELQEQFSNGTQHRQYSPGRKTWGMLDEVNANGYLDAVEGTPKETNVVVLIYDPSSKRSLEVEDELKTMAYRWSHIRFVKLHHEIAEMETVDIPAILAYRGGDVFATISGAQQDGLEDVLRSQGVLVR